MIGKIISGGQTGVDRAALDVALELGISCGGWCPRGRRAEDGYVPEQYPLWEMSTADYPSRTRCNVSGADATLILHTGPPFGPGTRLTMHLAGESGKPWMQVDMNGKTALARTRKWLGKLPDGVTLNVAGPRLSSRPGISETAADFLRELLG